MLGGPSLFLLDGRLGPQPSRPFRLHHGGVVKNTSTLHCKDASGSCRGWERSGHFPPARSWQLFEQGPESREGHIVVLAHLVHLADNGTTLLFFTFFHAYDGCCCLDYCWPGKV